MYEVTIQAEFSAAHNLREMGGKCESLHGHNFKVEVAVESERLDDQGMVIDFRFLKEKTRGLLDGLDHKYLNELPIFRGPESVFRNDCRLSFRGAFPSDRPGIPARQLGGRLGIGYLPSPLSQVRPMIDIQSSPDFRQIEINKVGVKNIEYPITVLDKRNKIQHTVGRVNMYVNLPHQFKGTHMSRFIEILNEYRGTINIKAISTILKQMKKKLNAESAYMEVEFPYFIEKRAPGFGRQEPDGLHLPVSGVFDRRASFPGGGRHGSR